MKDLLHNLRDLRIYIYSNNSLGLIKSQKFKIRNLKPTDIHRRITTKKVHYRKKIRLCKIFKITMVKETNKIYS